jgi:transmembrane protein
MDMFLRAVLTLLFWSAGLFGLFNFSQVVSEVRDIGLPNETLIASATILLQLGGSPSCHLQLRKLGWLGALVLAGFTLLTIPFGHAFWTFLNHAGQPNCISH